MLGPEVQRVNDPGVPFIWTMLPAADGGYFLGTGNDGKVVRVDQSRQRARVFFDSGEMEVHALAPAPNGGLYVGTSPDGRIYNVDAKGQATPFFDPDDKYIWALAVDPKGVVYAATGDKGDGLSHHARTARAHRSSRPRRRMRSRSRSMRADSCWSAPARRAASSASIRSGKGFLLLDTPYQEVTRPRVDPKGVLYVAAQSGTPSRAASVARLPPRWTRHARRAVPNVSTEITSFAIIDVPVTPQPAASSGSCRRSARTHRRRSIACCRTASGTSCGSRATTRRTTSRSKPTARCSSRRAARARSSGSPAIPMRPTLLTRVTAQQATMLHRTADRTSDHDVESRALVLALSSSRARPRHATNRT